MRVLLADDHVILRQALALLLDARPNITVVGSGSGSEIIQMTEDLHPDVVVMDIAMPRMNGIEATRTICSRFPGTKILMLSAYGDAQMVGEAIAAGASGFIIKRSDIDELVLALQLITTGNAYFSRELAAQMDIQEIAYAARTGSAASSNLTPREREVLQLVSEGHTMRSIADLLVISIKTAEGHNGRILAKLGVKNRAQLMRTAIGSGLVKLDGNGSLGDESNGSSASDRRSTGDPTERANTG